MLDTVAKIVGIIVGLLTIWQALASLTDAPVGRGPVAIVRDARNGSSNDGPPTVPSIPTGTQLGTPTGVSLSGDCDNGFTLTWSPVDGAERYRIERDGHFAGTEADTDYSIQAFPDGQEHHFRVFATALLRPQSAPSQDAVTDACSF